jgi:hypothetical protein
MIRRSIVAIATATLGLSVAMSAHSPAQANRAPASYVATPNGMVGVQQTLVVYAPRLVDQVVTLTGNQGSTGVTLQTVVQPSGFGSVFWTPTTAGMWTFSGAGSAASATPTTVSVAAAPTKTNLEIPNTMQVNTTANLLVTVTTNLGDLAPVGLVTVSQPGGAVIGSAYLTPTSGAEAAYASIPYTPTSTGVVTMTATFTPTNGNFSGSQAPQAGVSVTATSPGLSLLLPGTFNVGQTVFVTAFVTPSNQQGTAAIQVQNQGALSGSVSLVNGAVSVPWTPVNPGNTTVTAQFTNSGATASASASQPIAVGLALPPDRISVAPSGQAAWIPNTAITMRPGQNFLISGTAASGSPVVINESGPCVINAALLTAVSPGTCVITATSGGSASFTQGTATYQVSVAAAPRKQRR